MALGRWQATIVDEQGDIVPAAFVEVRRESAGGPLASLFSDRDGTVAIANPFQADTEAFAAFHTAGGPVKIRAYSGGFERIWRYVPVGTMAERDFQMLFNPMGAWSSVVTYAEGDMVSHVSGGAPYAFVSNSNGNLNHAPPFTGSVGTSNSFWTVLGLLQSGISANQNAAIITFVIDGGGLAVTSGPKGDVMAEFAGVITQASLLGDQTGSIVVDIWKDTYGNYPPTVLDSICAAAKPTLASAIKSQNTTLVGWTTAFAAGDTFRFNVEAGVINIQRVTVSLRVTKT
jgi:hypothetical protein